MRPYGWIGGYDVRKLRRKPWYNPQSASSEAAKRANSYDRTRARREGEALIRSCLLELEIERQIREERRARYILDIRYHEMQLNYHRSALAYYRRLAEEGSDDE